MHNVLPNIVSPRTPVGAKNIRHERNKFHYAFTVPTTPPLLTTLLLYSVKATSL